MIKIMMKHPVNYKSVFVISFKIRVIIFLPEEVIVFHIKKCNEFS